MSERVDENGFPYDASWGEPQGEEFDQNLNPWPNPDPFITFDTVVGKSAWRRSEIMGFEYGPQGGVLYINKPTIIAKVSDTLEVIQGKLGVEDDRTKV